MARPGRATQLKRGRERAKQEKRKEKLERRTMRKIEKVGAHRPLGGEDPDLAGIVPGPQPRPEWTYNLPAENEEEEEKSED